MMHVKMNSCQLQISLRGDGRENYFHQHLNVNIMWFIIFMGLFLVS